MTEDPGQKEVRKQQRQSRNGFIAERMSLFGETRSQAAALYDKTIEELNNGAHRSGTSISNVPSLNDPNYSSNEVDSDDDSFELK